MTEVFTGILPNQVGGMTASVLLQPATVLFGNLMTFFEEMLPRIIIATFSFWLLNLIIDYIRGVPFKIWNKTYKTQFLQQNDIYGKSYKTRMSEQQIAQQRFNIELFKKQLKQDHEHYEKEEELMKNRISDEIKYTRKNLAQLKDQIKLTGKPSTLTKEQKVSGFKNILNKF